MAEDLVQEMLLSALQGLIDSRGNRERTWLIAILRHKLLDYLRSRQNNQGEAAAPVDEMVDSWV